ncbi:MAG: short-chain dehydrogenase [Armatimonadetes bacterium]|nr:short-chain dehydrogenase [Armatimonadota bacterium]
MDIAGKTVLVLGGWGLVGSSVCRRLLAERPARLVVTSLHESEAHDAVESLRRDVPDGTSVEFVPWWGNIFGRFAHRTASRESLLAEHPSRMTLIHDIFDELSDDILHNSALYRLIVDHKVDAVVDCINTATAIAYQDIYGSVRTTLKAADAEGRYDGETVERLIASQYTPQLIRHIQLLYRSMLDAGTAMYVKIGTAGSGGMGLNIPYTHSEERPSRVLLSKSSVAGAQTLLLFLMARTPNGPVIKEIKPTATIAWKRIQHGEVLRKGHPIPLVDCPPEQGVKLEGSLKLKGEGIATPTGQNLTAPFIDTGENGIFSRGEFEAISSLQQMEMITPEEIAEATVFELKGGNSGHDVIAALDSTVYGPTYRGGYLRSRAVQRLAKLEEESGIPSVAFEMLGPPRLSKLLFEAHLLGHVAGSLANVVGSDAETLSVAADAVIRANADLRSRAISIGIPILMRDGVTLLRGDSMKIPPFRGDWELPITPEEMDHWAHAGWIDLRTENMEAWKNRLARIQAETEAHRDDDTSSRNNFPMDHWESFQTMPIGKIAAWIFTVEDEGARMKA